MEEKQKEKKKFVKLFDPFKIKYSVQTWNGTNEKFLFSKVRVNRILLPFGINAYDIGLHEIETGKSKVQASVVYLTGFVPRDEYIGTIITPRKIEYQYAKNGRLYPEEDYFIDPKNEITLMEYFDIMGIPKPGDH